MENLACRNSTSSTKRPIYGAVKGTIPTWLNGMLIRNGAGIKTIGNDRYNHPFDGLGQLHRYSFRNGKVTYENRFVESETYKKNMACQRIIASEFGTAGFPDPCLSKFSRFMSKFEIFTNPNYCITDNCSVNVLAVGDQLYAITESNRLCRMDVQTLGPMENVNLNNYIALNTATAHPHVLKDGTVINMGLASCPTGSFYCLTKTSPTWNETKTAFENTEIITKIPSRWKFNPGYFHSFGLTQNMLIFIEQPLCINVWKILFKVGVLKKSISSTLTWESNATTRFHVASIATGSLTDIHYWTKRLFLFHHINSYEDKEKNVLIVDVVGYDSGQIIKTSLPLPNGDLFTIPNDKLNQSVRRYILPLKIPKSRKIGENLLPDEYLPAKAILVKKHEVELIPEVLLKGNFELPRINYSLNGHEYKFVYGADFNSKTQDCSITVEFDTIKKLNVVTKQVLEWKEDGKFVSEPIFIQTPNSTEEDDGIILTTLLTSGQPTKSTLVILNAKNLCEIGRADFDARGTVMPTFHGKWLGSEDRIHFL